MDELKKFYRKIEENGYKAYGDDYVSYGCLKDTEEGDYIEVPYATFSDYSGSTVEYSNYRTFLDRYGEFDGVKELRGGFYTRGIIVKISSLTDVMLDDINGLLDYPLMDEEDFSELEYNLAVDEIARIAKELDGYDDVWTEELINKCLDHAWQEGLIEPVYEHWDSCYFHGIDEFLSEKLHIDTNV